MRLRALGLVMLLACGLFGGASRPARAEGCSQINDRVYGQSGQGGNSVRFKFLSAKAEQEAAAGDTAGAARDRAAAAKLAASIIADAKALKAAGCTPRTAGSASGSSGGSSGTVSTGTASSGTSTTRSSHGCVGFAGRWSTDYGLTTLDASGNGTYLYKGTSRIAGSISPDRATLTGTYVQVDDRGTVTLRLDPGGDSFRGSWTSASGSAGTWNGTCTGA